MELIKITQCTSNLNFEPLQELKSSLTPTAYAGELLNGFLHDPNGMALNYPIEHCTLITLLKGLYEELSYIEILRLWVCLEQTPHLLEPALAEDFFSAFGLRLDENLRLTNSLVLQLPKSFLNWCAQKKWGPQDFAPLRAFANGISKLAPYLEKLNNPLSKNDGTQIFELLVELLMLDKDPLHLPQLELSLWLATLKQERYPLSAVQTKKNEEFIQKNSWPLHSQPKWVRKGDKSGFELKLFFSHPQELERSLSKLEQLKTKDLWSID